MFTWSDIVSAPAMITTIKLPKATVINQPACSTAFMDGGDWSENGENIGIVYRF